MKHEQIRNFAIKLYDKGYTDATWHMSRDDLREISRYTQAVGLYIANHLSDELERAKQHWEQEEQDEKEDIS